MPKHDEITEYRPCVGVMLLNEQGRVWIGRRYDKANEEGEGYWWQMPQGGIDKGEDAAAAALRELAEETAVTSAHVIAESSRWYNYDLPEHLIGKSWKGKYRGQTQKCSPAMTAR
jgi:putative (di)nucleoside polyphosphate hydrolase